jgi:phage-related protein
VTKVVAAAQWLLNAALDANPVVLIAAGIIGLVVALVIAYKKSQTFRTIVNAAFNSVKSVAQTAWNIISNAASTAWNIIHPIISFLASILGHVKDGLMWMKNHAGDAFSALKGAIQAVSGVVSTVLGPLKSALDWIINSMKWIANHISSLKNSVEGFFSGVSASAGSSGGGGVGFGGHPNPQVSTNFRMAPQVISIQVDSREIYRAVVDHDKITKRQTGRSLLGT